MGCYSSRDADAFTPTAPAAQGHAAELHALKQELAQFKVAATRNDAAMATVSDPHQGKDPPADMEEPCGAAAPGLASPAACPAAETSDRLRELEREVEELLSAAASESQRQALELREAWEQVARLQEVAEAAELQARMARDEAELLRSVVTALQGGRDDVARRRAETAESPMSSSMEGCDSNTMLLAELAGLRTAMQVQTRELHAVRSELSELLEAALEDAARKQQT